MKTGLYNNKEDSSKKKLYEVIKSLPEGEYVYEFKKNSPNRSVSHNAYYRIVLQSVAAYTGDTEDRLHEFYKKKFNSVEVQGEWVGDSTSHLSSSEFNIYIKKVKDHAREFFGCVFIEREDKHYRVWEQMTKNAYNAMFQAS